MHLRTAGEEQSPPLGGLRSRGHIAVISTNQHVDPMGTHVAYRKRQVRGNLTLHVEVPLQHVISMGMCFNGGGAQASRDEAAATWGRTREEVIPPGRELSLQCCPVVSLGKYHEGRSLVFLQEKVSGKRQNIIDTKASADRSLSIAEWVPGKAYAGFKVAKCGIAVVRPYTAADTARGMSAPRSERGGEQSSALRLRGGSRSVVANIQ